MVLAAGEETVIAVTPPTASVSSPGRLMLRKTPQTDDTTAGLSGSPQVGGDSGGGDGGGGSSFCRSLVLDPSSPQKDLAVLSSPSTAVAAAIPKADWFSAAVSRGKGGGSRGGGGGGESAVGEDNNSRRAADAVGVTPGVARGRDAKLSSVLALSPGKEYWTERIADRGASGSTSPPTVPARNRENLKKTKNNGNTFGGAGFGAAASSPREVSDPSISPVMVEHNSSCALSSLTGRQKQKQQQQQQREEELSCSGGGFSVGSSAGISKKKDYLSFTAGKRGAPLSPGGAGGATYSVWPTQQAFGSVGRSPAAGSHGGGRGWRLDPCSSQSVQPGEVRSPFSPSSQEVASPSPLSLSPTRCYRRRGFSPASRRIALEENAAVGTLPAARWSGRVSSLNFSPAGGGSSFGTPPFKFSSPSKASLGTSFGGGSQCSFSSLQTQVTKTGGRC